jgi:hypothetical protein
MTGGSPWTIRRRVRASSLFLVLTGSLLACNPATFSRAAPYDAACDPILEFPCEAGAPDTPGCVGNHASTGALERLIPEGASYPVDCTVIVPHPVKNDVGECDFEGSCRCNPSDAGVAWTCTL